MSSKKTSKTTPKQNTKRYIVFIGSNDTESVTDCHLGTYSNKSEIELDILDEIDVSGMDNINIDIYDMHLNRWLNDVTIVPNGINITWTEPDVK